jgi:hypothetical protein
MVDGA